MSRNGLTLDAIIGKGFEQLKTEDPILYRCLEGDARRQARTLSLVASSGGTDCSVLAAMSSTSVNITAEGYPGARYHAGCEWVDQVEQLAIERAKRAFSARYANVQPLCASSANHIVMSALLQPGDRILGMALDHGGHLTHGAPVNLSGKLYKAFFYGIDRTGRIDFEQVRDLAHRYRPKLIICGTTSYPRVIEFSTFRKIADEVGAWLLADITHIAGLVATGLHPSPIDEAHVTTTCTFKQLFGPRGGLILMGRDAESHGPQGTKGTLAQLIQRSVFPVFQGAPAINVIAAKARAFDRLPRRAFRDLAARILANARGLAGALEALGYHVCSGGTDNHIVLFETPNPVTGIIAQQVLEQCGIIVYKNKTPGDKRPVTITSGVRLGTNTVALRGMDAPEMHNIARIIADSLNAARVLTDREFVLSEKVAARTRRVVAELTKLYPMPYERMIWTTSRIPRRHETRLRKRREVSV